MYISPTGQREPLCRGKHVRNQPPLLIRSDTEYIAARHLPIEARGLGDLTDIVVVVVVVVVAVLCVDC